MGVGIGGGQSREQSADRLVRVHGGALGERWRDPSKEDPGVVPANQRAQGADPEKTRHQPGRFPKASLEQQPEKQERGRQLQAGGDADGDCGPRSAGDDADHAGRDEHEHENIGLALNGVDPQRVERHGAGNQRRGRPGSWPVATDDEDDGQGQG